MSAKTTNREFKFERWLVLLTDRFKGSGVTPRLFYTDKAKGDWLALVVGSVGFVELLVHRVNKDDRRGHDGAILVLLADSVAALREFTKALGDLHHDTSRLQNERRKFYHRVERIADHLLATFDLRLREFPQESLATLTSWVPGAAPMVGIEATFRTKEHEPEATRLENEPDAAFRKREAQKYLARFAARVVGPTGLRAALYDPASKRFILGFVPQAPQATLASAAIVGGGALIGEKVNNQGSGMGNATEIGIDLAELGVDAATSGCIDCGGIDFPDCDFVDVPDCSGCDCSL